jgi:hypothetical protein
MENPNQSRPLAPWIPRVVAGAVVALGICSFMLAEEGKVSFKPAEVKEVGEIFVPSPGQTNGTVVLNAVISDEGKPQSIEVRRGIEGLTGPATDAVKDWTFTPALLNGKPVTTRVVVAVTLHPWGPGAFPVPLPPLLPQSDEAIQAEFQPPDVVRAAFPRYPDLTKIGGTVVLEVDLDEKGEQGGINILKDLPPLTETSEAALTDWRFRAGMDNGTPTPSKIVLAFVFQPWTPPAN